MIAFISYLKLLFVMMVEKYENYAVERPVSYFKDILDKHTTIVYKSSDALTMIGDRLLTGKIAKYISSLFKDEYNIISSKHISSFIDTKRFNHIETTSILLHRRDKMHGISIIIRTLHDLDYSKFDIIQSDILLVSQDIFSLGSSDDGSRVIHQEYSNFDEKITKSTEYEKQFLKSHYEKIKRYRGITVD